MSLGISLRPNTKPIEAWQAAATPQPNQPEVVPYALYDTQTYVQAGLTGPVSFFQTVQTDTTLSNMQAAGSLPNPQWFEIQKVYVDVLSDTSAAAGAANAAGGFRDYFQIRNIARANLTLSMANKTYGNWPLHLFGASAGYLPGTCTTLAAGAIFATPPAQDNGGFPLNGQLIIPPQVNFVWTLNAVASVAISADTKIRITMVGNLARLTR